MMHFIIGGLILVPDELSLMHLDILRLIESGANTNKMISKRLQLPRSTLKRRLDDLLGLHLIKKQIAGNARVYGLSSQGTDLLNAGYRTPPKKRFDLKAHKVQWSAVIVKKPWKLHDALLKNSFTVSQHKNWSKYKVRDDEEGVTIVFNPKKVHFFLHEFFIDSPMEYYDVAQEKLLRIKKSLEEKFPGLVLGEPKKLFTVHSQHIVKQGGPLAKKFEEYAQKTGNPQVYHGKRLDIDHSQGDWEEETKDPRLAPADMHDLGHFFDSWLEEPFFPGDVKRMRSEVSDVQVRQKADSDEIMRSMAALSEGMVAIGKTVGENELRAAHRHDQAQEQLTTFAVAMHEHVTLVKALQENAFALTKQSALQNKNFQAQGMAMEAQAKAMEELVGLVYALQRPWYAKLADSVKEWLFSLRKK
jgi:predicted transcriptional regulator